MPGSNRDDTLVPAMVRAARRRGYAGRFVLVSQIVVVIALMIMFVVGITGGVLTWGLSGGGDPGNDLIQSFSNALGAFVVLLLFVVLAVASYVALWIVPFLIALPVTLPLAVLWSQPRRFLVLRPFNHEANVRALRAVIRRSIGRYGHTYTLSDKRITALAEISDLVLIDITERRTTIAWEIEHCRNIGVLDRVVFLAEASAAAKALAWIEVTLGANPPPLVRYAGAELIDATLFQALVVQHNLRTELAPDRRARKHAIGVVAAAYTS